MLIKTSDHTYLCPRMHPKSYSRAFEKSARRAGLEGSLHWLRHSFCINLLLGGSNIRTVQMLAGHSTITVTENYLRVIPDKIAKEAVSNMI